MANQDVVMPQPGGQMLFLQSSHVFEVLFEGERGPGKSWAMLHAFAQHTGKGYGSHWRGVIFRKESSDLKDMIEKSHREFKLAYPDAKYNKTEKTWTWPTGEILTFAHFKDENDYWSWHGQEIPFIGWEELTVWANDKGYTSMFSCCRSTGPIDMPRIVRATTNPYGPGKNWVKRRFKLPQNRYKIWRDVEEDGSLSNQRLAIPGFLHENKILLKLDPNYIKNVKASAKGNVEKLKAWLFGDWDAVSGGMFDDVWTPRVHIIDPFAIPRGWRISHSYDWGGAKPGSYGIYATSNGEPVEVEENVWMGEVRGDVFRIGEWYTTSGRPNEGLSLTPRDQAQGMIALHDKLGIRGRVRMGVADHNIFDKSNGSCTYDTLKKYGLKFRPADKGPLSRVKGWEVMRDKLQASIPGKYGGREDPGLYIFNTCPYFIELVPALVRSQKNPDDIDTESEDHIADEVRYFLRQPKRGAKRTHG